MEKSYLKVVPQDIYTENGCHGMIATFIKWSHAKLNQFFLEWLAKLDEAFVKIHPKLFDWETDIPTASETDKHNLLHLAEVLNINVSYVKLSQKRNTKVVITTIQLCFFFCWVYVQHIQKIIENCIFRNHSSMTTSCLPLGLFIAHHILSKTQPCPAGKPKINV